ncbi:pepsin/retropepsin-like aspartic protease family protein [Ornithinibacillus californiensis]|uniref:hypothetical protein n=1 Tax=Ornithinibacillus californiensis TaxID=161536 RepID=UPI00064E0114|nr:hypothetical protein [Ornithinibacillus californiensis]
MKLEFVNNLLETKMGIYYKGKTKVIDKLVIDTLISSDIVDDIGIYLENGDSLVSSFGIGGEEYSFRKQVDFIKLGSYYTRNPKLDFGNLSKWGINGLIGLDILMAGKFIIDLRKLEITQ